MIPAIRSGTIALVSLAICASAAAAEPAIGRSEPDRGQQASAREIAPFLPSYYAPAFVVGADRLRLAEHEEKNGLSRYAYATGDSSATLVLEEFKCDDAHCKAVFDNALKYIDGQATAYSGSFHAVSEPEFHAEWKVAQTDIAAFVFKLPHALHFWTYGTMANSRFDGDARFAELRSLANRQRYEEALAEGNVEMGRWASQTHDHARQLMKEGKRTEAIAVYKDLLATAPFDYVAHMEFAESTTDRAAASESARVVRKNAETPDVIARAARFLGEPQPSFASVPEVDASEGGLQLVLVPLPPVSVELLAEASKVYEKITEVPVKIRRLREGWRFGAPDRLLNQRAIQQTIIDQQGPDVDFTLWGVERYGAALMRTVESKDALSQFWMKTYVDKLDENSGQYEVEPLLQRFIDILAKYRSKDRRTMYVGVTEKNIYMKKSNYIFSAMSGNDSGSASILSYAMMLAKSAGEPNESRTRLAERIAKELVPASLKILGIPRPTDPSDPYSYSNGIERLAQKSLVLSAPVKQALDKFR